MRNVAFGTVAGLVIGMIGALAYSHYFGDGKLLADLQAQLDAANADLARMKSARQLVSNEYSSSSDQVDALFKSNEDLKRQLDAAKKARPAVPALNPMTLAGTIMGMMRGGGFSPQQRMLLLKSRLHLTADQQTAIQAAMDADNKQRQQLMRQWFQNRKIDPQTAAAANTLDSTLATVLTPEQQTAYQQLQTDEQTSRANTSATIQVNQVAPLLQLSDAQKDQMFNAVYQVQMNAPDPTSLMTNPNAMTVLASQVQATQQALASVLTPDQMALYQQESQATPGFGFGGR